MFKAALIGAVIGAMCWAQMPEPAFAQQSSAAQGQQQQEPLKQTIVVPAGTAISLTLETPIYSKTTKRGDPIRAVVAFPVTVGNQLAIPAGAYVSGTIDSFTKRGSSGPTLRAQFNELLFSNGYTVPMESENIVAQEIEPAGGSMRLASYTPGSGAGFELAAQQAPQPPPLKSSGPSGGVIAGFVAAAVAGIVALLLVARHNGGANYMVFETGWNFQIALQSPLTLDASQVAAATSGNRL